MSKTEKIIATGNVTLMERRLANPNITEWSQKMLREAIAAHKSAPAPAAKSARVPATPAHTQARSAANEVKRAYYRLTGTNLRYDVACSLFGTAPANSGDERLTKAPKAVKGFSRKSALADPDAFVAEHLEVLENA